METLVVVSHHRNHQYYSRSKSHFHGRFGSSPSRGFKDINCKFQSNAGILPNPFKSCNASSSVTIKAAPLSPNPRQDISLQSERNRNNLKNNVKSNAIPIKFEGSDKEKACEDDLCYSELWAGPAYSNSPPPSSLPLPKFSMRQTPSVSLELPVPEPGFKFHPLAKSAPSSPKRDWSPSPINFSLNTDFATKDLRRMLHLDIADDE